MNAASQWTTIGWMIASGFLMGLVFDLYRVVSFRFRIPRWLLPALDVVYWTAATLGVFKLLLDSNHGEVRLYVFLGLGIGVTGYFGLFSGWVVKAANIGVTVGIRLSTWSGKTVRLLLIVPLMAIVRALARLLDILFVVTAAIVLWILRLLLIPLRPALRYAWKKLLPVRRKAAEWADTWRRWRDKMKALWELLRKK